MNKLFILLLVILFCGCIPKTVNESFDSQAVDVDSYFLGDYKISVKFYNQLKLFEKTRKDQAAFAVMILFDYKNFLVGKTIYSFLASKGEKNIQFYLIHSQDKNGEYYLVQDSNVLDSAQILLKVEMPLWIICNHMFEDGKSNESKKINFYGELHISVPYKDIKERVNFCLEKMLFQ